MTIPASDTAVPHGHIDRRWIWIIVGAGVAALPAIATAGELETRYLLYGALGVGLLAIAPYLITAAGSSERLLWTIFVLSLQLELAFSPIVGPQKDAGPYGTMISLTLLSSLALLALWASARTWAGGERLNVDRRLVLAAAGVVCAALLSLVNAAGRWLGLFGVFELLSLTLTAIVANHGCSRRRNILTVQSALFVCLFIQSAFIVVEQISGVQISLARGVNSSYAWGGGSEGRFAGTFGAPSSAATFLVVCLLFLFRRLTSVQPPSRPIAFWALFAFGFLALLLTRTRSEWIGFAIGWSGMGWQCYREGSLSKRALIRLLAGGAVALVVAWPLVAQRLADDHKGAADTRENLVRIAVAMIKANPITGVGINTATNQVYGYAASAGVSGWVFIVHNQFFLVAAETGVPGIAAFVGLTWIGLRAARRCMRSGDALISEGGAALFWSLWTMVWALNLDNVSGTMTYMLYWFLIGAACGLNSLRQQADGAPRGALARA